MLPQTFFITDGQADRARLDQLIEAALAGGIRGLQIREPTMPAREIAALCEVWKPRCDELDALLIVNDRVDIVATGLAHGVQLGNRSLPVDRARSILPVDSLIGSSVHDTRQMAAGAAADFFVLAPLFATGSKPGATPLGAERAVALVASAPRPTLLLGGITRDNVTAARQIGAQGVAVMGALCHARDPRAAAAELVATETPSPR